MFVVIASKMTDTSAAFSAVSLDKRRCLSMPHSIANSVVALLEKSCQLTKVEKVESRLKFMSFAVRFLPAS